MTPLMYAAPKDNLLVGKLLLKHKARIDQKTEDGRNVLHLAATFDQVPLTEFL